MRTGASTSVTLLDSYTPFQENWFLIFPIISKILTVLSTLHSYLILHLTSRCYYIIIKSFSAQIGKWGCYVGAWFIGLGYTKSVVTLKLLPHLKLILVLGRIADCEWKAQAGNICVAAFDSTCSGICRSADPIVEVNMQCVDLEIIIWKLHFEAFPQHINRP